MTITIPLPSQENWLKQINFLQVSSLYKRISENFSQPFLSLIPRVYLSSAWKARDEEGIENKIYCMQRSSVIPNACGKKPELPRILTWPPLINVQVLCAHHIYIYFAHCCFQSSSKYFIFKTYSAKTIHRTCLWLRIYSFFCVHTQENLKMKHKEN